MRFPVPGGGFVDVPIRWFFSPGRPFLKTSTPYGSINWKNAEERPPDGPGEVVGASRPFVNGNPPIPDCCPDLERFHGGLAAGGSAFHDLSVPLEAEGGGLGNSEATFREAFAAIGGGLGNGQADFGTGWRSEGGGLGDGEAYFEVLGYGLGGGLGNGEADFSGDTPVAFETGMILFFGHPTPPTGWLACDGSAVSRTTYSALFGVIGTTFGAGDGSTTFNVPNAKGRLTGGTGTLSGGSTRSLGDVGGVESHTITSSEMPAHTHGLQTGGISGLAGATTYVSGGGAATQTGSTGGVTAMNLMNPFIFLTCIIKT